MKPIAERVEDKVLLILFHPCWEWAGSKDVCGYGAFKYNGSMRGAHRFSYELYKGPIPKGLVIDHLCRNRGCVNPHHLEAKTHKENINSCGSKVGILNRTKTHCKNGHPFSKENTFFYSNGYRDCKECTRINDRKYYWRDKNARNAL